MARISPVIWLLIISFGVLLITVDPSSLTYFNFHLRFLKSSSLSAALIQPLFRDSFSLNNLATATATNHGTVGDQNDSIVLDLLSSFRDNNFTDPASSSSPKPYRTDDSTVLDGTFSLIPLSEPSPLSEMQSFTPISTKGEESTRGKPLAIIDLIPRYNSTATTIVTPLLLASQTVNDDLASMLSPTAYPSIEPSSSFDIPSESLSPFASTDGYAYTQMPSASSTALPVEPQKSRQPTKTPSPNTFVPRPSRDTAPKVSPTITPYYYPSVTITSTSIYTSPSFNFDDTSDDLDDSETSFTSDQPTDDVPDISVAPELLYSVSFSPPSVVIVVPAPSRAPSVSSSAQMAPTPFESPSIDLFLSTSPSTTTEILSQSERVTNSPMIKSSESVSSVRVTPFTSDTAFSSNSASTVFVSISDTPSVSLTVTASVSTSASSSILDPVFPSASLSVSISSSISSSISNSISSSTTELATIKPQMSNSNGGKPTEHTSGGTMSQILSQSPHTDASWIDNLDDGVNEDTIPYPSTISWEETPFPSSDILVALPPAGGNQIGELTTNPIVSSQDGVLNQESGESFSPIPTASGFLVSSSPSSPPTTEIIPPVGASATPFDISPSVSPIIASSSATSIPSLSPVAVASPLLPSASSVSGSSQAPDTVTDADTPIVPSSVGPSGYPSISSSLGPPQPEVVPDTNDTGIVTEPSGSPNTTLADNSDGSPSIVAGGQWKDLLNTGPAGLAFPIIMGIVGALLVLLLLVCLTLALLRGSKSDSQLSGSQPIEYGGGAPYGEGGVPGGAQPFIVESPPPSLGQPPPAGYDGDGSYGGYDMRNDDTGVNFETPSDPPYSRGGGTALKNASVGTTGYPIPTQLPSDLNYGDPGRAMTDYEQKEYPYEHPYGQTYGDVESTARRADGMLGFMYSQYTDPRARVISESRPYSLGGTQESYSVSSGGEQARETYDSAIYKDEADVTSEGNAKSSNGPDVHYNSFSSPKIEQGSVATHKFREWENDVTQTREYDSVENDEGLRRPRTIQFCGEPYTPIQSNGIIHPSSSSRGFSDSITEFDPELASAQNDEQMYDADGGNLELQSGLSSRVPQRSTYSSTDSDLVQTPFETRSQGDTMEDSSANGAGSNEVSSFVVSGLNKVSDEQPDEDGSASFKRYASLAAAQQEAFSTVFNSSSRSQTSSAGPWPMWWKRTRGHGDSVMNEAVVHDIKENSFAPVYGFEDGDENSASALAAYDEEEESNSEHEIQLEFDNASSLFGPKLAFAGSEWQDDTHHAVHKQAKVPNPQFDYLRKLREPYVKAMANRLSLKALSSSTTTESIRDDADKKHMTKAQKKKSIDPRYSIPWNRFMNGEQILQDD